jgi:hypothetical protein
MVFFNTPRLMESILSYLRNGLPAATAAGADSAA